MPDLQRNLSKLLVLRALSSSFMWIPTLVLFYQSHQIRLVDVFLLKATLMCTTMLFEIPSGYFADLFGRKRSIIIGGFGLLAAMVLYATGSTFFDFVLAEITLGIGGSFISGADTALMYDSLLEQGRETEYHRQEGRITAAGSYSEAVGGLLGGWLAGFSLYYPYYAQCILFVCLTITALSLVEPKRHLAIDRSKKLTEFVRAIRFSIVSNSKLRAIMFYNACDASATFAIVWLCQPYMTSIGISITQIGIVWFLLHIWLGLCASNSAAVSDYFGPIRTLSLFVLLSASGYLLMSLIDSWWGVLPIFLFYTARGVRIPLVRKLINDETNSDIRATVISVLRFLGSAAFLIIGPLLGWISDSYGLRAALFSSSVIFAVLGLLTFRKIKQTHGT